MQRLELKATREELSRSAKAQEQSQLALKKQVYLTALAAYLSCVEKYPFTETTEKMSRILNRFQDILDKMDPDEILAGQ